MLTLIKKKHITWTQILLVKVTLYRIYYMFQLCIYFAFGFSKTCHSCFTNIDLSLKQQYNTSFRKHSTVISIWGYVIKLPTVVYYFLLIKRRSSCLFVGVGSHLHTSPLNHCFTAAEEPAAWHQGFYGRHQTDGHCDTFFLTLDSPSTEATSKTTKRTEV